VLAQPATLQLDYGSLVNSLNSEGEISLQVWNQELHAWQQVAATLNAGEYTLSAQITPLATYGLWQKEVGNTIRLPTLRR
jgi:hypothetical protein